MQTDWNRLYHRAFDVGILLKGLDGLLECIGGLALLLTTRREILAAVGWLTRAELIEDPGDFVATHLAHLAQQLSLGTQHFAGFYLLGHGVIKLGLVIGLLRGARWSYPAAVVFLTAFIGYQGYRLAHTPSLALSLLTALDIAVVLLIIREWRRRISVASAAKSARAPD